MSRVTWDDAVAITEQRRSMNAPLLQQMLEVEKRYNGDVAIPLPDMDTSPVMPALTPSLMALTIDSYATRAASVMPRVECPAIDPTKLSGLRSSEFARIRQKTIYATWHKSKFQLSLRRVYRHISGYATSALVVVPDYIRGFPTIEVRSPLGAYPEPKAPEDLSPVANCAFIYARSADWLRSNFPEARSEAGGPVGPPGAVGEMWDLVEWLDEYQTIIGILAPADLEQKSAQDSRQFGLKPTMPLRVYENMLGRCPVVTTERVTLDRIFSQVAAQIGNIDLQAKMLALAIVAEERAIFPDRYVVAADGRTPRIVSNGGAWADGRTGETNLLDGVNTVGQLNSAPPQSTYQIQDRLERNYAVSAGTNPTFGGETYGALRTGRGIESLLGAQVDPQVQEMQHIVEFGMSHVNDLVLDTWRCCFDPDGKKKYTLFSGWGGISETIELEPKRHIETCDNVVSYPIGGTDVQGTTIQLGQLQGTGMISSRTARNMHPFIPDADFEERQIDHEKLKDAGMQGLLQQVMSGQSPIPLAKVDKYMYEDGMEFFAAVDKVNEDMQKMQAQQAPATDEAEPTMVGAPQAMPGIAGAPQMQPPGPAGEIQPPQGAQSFRRLMDALNAAPPGGAQ